MENYIENYDINLHKLCQLNNIKNKLHDIYILIEKKENHNEQYLKFLQDMMDEAIKNYNVIIQTAQPHKT